MADKEHKAPENHGETLKFSELVHELFEPIHQLSTRQDTKVKKPEQRKMLYMKAFLDKWRDQVGPDIFPFMRLVIPLQDRDRIYRVKELTLAKLLVSILGINPKSEDAHVLTHWKQPSGNAPAGNFPGCVYYVHEKRSVQTADSKLSIAQVNDMLDALAQVSKEADQNPLLKEFHDKMSSLEFRWLTAIVLKAVKIGMSEKAIFPLMHPDAQQLFNLTSSLSRVCWQLHDPEQRLSGAERSVNIFSCFQPQLATFNAYSFDMVVKKIGSNPFYIEEKLDGERLQMHMSKGKFRYWSRLGNESTARYGSCISPGIEGGALTRYLEGVFDKRVKSVVLEGEMILWDPVALRPFPFGSLKGVAEREARSENGPDDPYPFFNVFDLVLLNGTSVTNQSLRGRRKALQEIITPIPRRFEIAPVQEATTAEEIETRLRECVANTSEGLMVKNPDSVYSIGERNHHWIKVKPEYMSGHGLNLDVIVLGATYGTGRRGNVLSSYLCGIRCDPPAGSSIPCRKFLTFCRVGGGFSQDDYRKIKETTEGKWQKFDPKNVPDYVVFKSTPSGSLQQQPDVIIKPEDSVVIQIKASSAEDTNQFATPKTLRFPRFERLREDRNWANALSELEFQQMQDDVSEKLMEAHSRKRAAPRARIVKPTLHDANPGLEDVVARDHILDGATFFVTSDSRSLRKSKQEFERIVVQHGGNVVQNDGLPLPPKKTTKRKRSTTPEPGNFSSDVLVLGDTWGIRQSAIKQRDLLDIMRFEWVLDSIEAGHLLEKTPKYMHFATSETETKMAQQVDAFGDSWVEHTTPAKLEALLKNMSEQQVLANTSCSHKDLTHLQRELDEVAVELHHEPWWHFAGFKVYLEETPDFVQAMLSANAGLSVRGAELTTDLMAPDVTHYVVADRHSTALVRIRRVNSIRKKIGHVVSADWVLDSIKEGTLLAESRYAC